MPAATYWVDHAGSATAPYDTQAKAATALQTVLDLAVAGDTIYCCDNGGTGEVTAATIDVDTQTGTNAAGWIKVIGCNSAGVVDGTRYYINANGGAYSVITAAATADMYWFENIEVGNTGVGAYHGFKGAATCQGWVFIDCCAHNCGGTGWEADTTFSDTLWVRCVAYSNTANGFGARGSTCKFIFCAARDNTGSGFVGYYPVLFGCISHGNTDDGYSSAISPLLINCVLDGNGDNGFDVTALTLVIFSTLIGCRVTNHSGAGDIGVNCASDPLVTGWCYFEDNDGDNIQNATLHQFIPVEGGSTTTNLEDLANTNEGYAEAVANNNFATGYTDSGDPDLRRVAITIPWS